MNGRELTKPSLGDCPLSSEETALSLDDAQLESWAAVVASCLQPTVFDPPAVLGLGLGSVEPVAPEGWRPSVRALTPGDASAVISETHVVTGVGEKTTLTEVPQRIQLRVNTKECGEVALVVERAEEGLRVVIAAVDGNAVKALHREAVWMRLALESGGQNVVSLKVIRMDQGGTKLAQDGLTSRPERHRSKKANGSGAKSHTAKRTSRRLTVIG